MGRSVLTHPDSIETLYFALPDLDELREMRGEWDEDVDDLSDDALWTDCQFVFEDARDSLFSIVSEQWPSFQEEDRWLRHPNDEIHVVAANFAVEVTISEYCGLVAIDVAHREPDYDYWDPSTDALARAWAERMAPRIAEQLRANVPLQPELALMGRFSNGEAVFTTVEAA